MESTDKSLIDFQDEWEKLVTKGFDDFQSLIPNERIWFTVQGLLGDVNNGGLISHYYNHGADRNKETIDDLETLGFSDIADLLKRINNWFPGGQPSPDVEERNRVISDWEGEEYDELLENFDNQFYDKGKELEDELIRHIETKVLSSMQ